MGERLGLRYPLFGIAWIVTGLACPVWAQSADKILSQHVAAVGGAKALKARVGVEYRGEARDDATGERGSFTLSIHAPDSIYIELAASNGGWSEGDNGKSAWRHDSGHGPRTLSGPESRQLKVLGHFLNTRFLDYKKDNWFPTSLGSASVDGHNADIIEMANGITELAGVKCKFYFDTGTHMLLKQEQPDGAGYLVYGDYRPVNGVAEPFHITWHQDNRTLELILTKITHNPPFDPHLYDYPGATTPDKPDIDRLFQDLMKHQSDMDKVRQLYSCTLDETEEDVNSKGKVTKSTTQRYYLFYLGSHQFRKHIATNGQPLGDKEMKKEDDRIAKEQRQAEADEKRKEERRQQTQARREAAAAKSGQPSPDAEDENDDQDFVRALLKVMQFSNFRREPFRGHDVLAFDFGPNPAYKPHGLIESLVSKFIGTLWVDEKDHEVTRVQARLSESFKIAGGVLASLSAGSSFVVEQEKVNDEVWLPIFEEDHFAGRLLFLSGKGYETDRYSDYKKFSADSKVTFKDVPH